jgi:hypothetical protein
LDPFSAWQDLLDPLDRDDQKKPADGAGTDGDRLLDKANPAVG